MKENATGEAKVEKSEEKSSLHKNGVPVKRNLECAGSVSEKCRPNPDAKRCCLEDVVRVSEWSEWS